MSQVSMEQVRATYKARDSWWTVLLVDPLVGPLVRVAAARPWLTPNRLTGLGFLFGLAAAASFLRGSAGWLVLGVLLYHTGFMVDCMDGKIARLQGSGSVFGGWLDFFLDRIRVVLCAVALFAGQWHQTGDVVFLFAATGFVFLALFGYVNGAETDKARAKLAADTGPVDEQTLLAQAAGQAAGLVGSIRAALHRRRIRLNLISGIEFELAVLVVAPLAVAATGGYALLWVAGGAATLLVAFELALIFRFWVATRSSARHAPAFDKAPAADVPQQRAEHIPGHD